VVRHVIKVILFVICVTLLMLGCANPALEHLRQGDSYSNRKLWDEAIIEYSKAIELDPGFAIAYSKRGTAYNMKELYDLAIADCNKAILLAPNLAEVYWNRSLAYKALGEKSKAIADIEKFITLTDNPQWIEMVEQEIEELSR